MKTVFITGASSAIGRVLLKKLSIDHRVYALVHRAPLSIAGENIFPVKGELNNPSNYTDAVSQSDVILHVAGLTHSASPEAYEQVNHQGTAALLSVCRRDQRILYVSSRCLGEHGGAYSRSKELAEREIVQHGLRYTIIRPSEIYGSKAGEGIDALIQYALKYRVVLDFRWRGPITYSPISVDEVCVLIENMVRNEIRERSVYTVCNNAVYSAKDIHAALAVSRQRQMFLLPISVRMLMALKSLGLPLPFKTDQLTRMVVPKSNDCRLVSADYGFAPEDFSHYLARSAAAPFGPAAATRSGAHESHGSPRTQRRCSRGVELDRHGLRHEYRPHQW